MAENIGEFPFSSQAPDPNLNSAPLGSRGPALDREVRAAQGGAGVGCGSQPLAAGLWASVYSREPLERSCLRDSGPTALSIRPSPLPSPVPGSAARSRPEPTGTLRVTRGEAAVRPPSSESARLASGPAGKGARSERGMPRAPEVTSRPQAGVGALRARGEAGKGFYCASSPRNVSRAGAEREESELRTGSGKGESARESWKSGSGRGRRFFRVPARLRRRGMLKPLRFGRS